MKDYYQVSLNEEGQEITGLSSEQDDVEQILEDTELNDYMEDVRIEEIDKSLYLVGLLKEDVTPEQVLQESGYVQDIEKYIG